MPEFKVTQLSPEEAQRMREEARRIVDGVPPPRKNRPAQVPVRAAGGSGLVRAVGAVVGAARAVGGAVRSAAEWCYEHRLDAVEGTKAFAAFAARYGLEAARDAVRSEIRRRVTGALTPSGPSFGQPPAHGPEQGGKG